MLPIASVAADSRWNVVAVFATRFSNIVKEWSYYWVRDLIFIFLWTEHSVYVFFKKGKFDAILLLRRKLGI